jgi:hypothetical protein
MIALYAARHGRSKKTVQFIFNFKVQGVPYLLGARNSLYGAFRVLNHASGTPHIEVWDWVMQMRETYALNIAMDQAALSRRLAQCAKQGWSEMAEHFSVSAHV